jgi:small redox-active disulfide protein 2
MKIEILGVGCAKCNSLERNVRQAVDELGLAAEVQKIEDIAEIMKYGVMATPALVVNGELKASGKLLSIEKIKEVFRDYR